MLWSTDFPFLALTLFVGAAIPGSLYTPAIYGMFGLTPLMVMLAIVRSCFQMAGAFADWVMRSLSTPVTRALVTCSSGGTHPEIPEDAGERPVESLLLLALFFPVVPASKAALVRVLCRQNGRHTQPLGGVDRGGLLQALPLLVFHQTNIHPADAT
jgi:hypothetical protein